MRAERGDGWELRLGSCWDEPNNRIDGGLAEADAVNRLRKTRTQGDLFAKTIDRSKQEALPGT